MKTMGAAYYPEHWPVERQETDYRLMKEAGITAVRMAEFAWCRLEPEPGRYDFSWLDEAVERAANFGIKTILCTPTATPPAWMIEEDPTILPLKPDGNRMAFGSRRHYCPSHPGYRRLSAEIARAMAEHYAGNPHVMAWQIDNELYGNTGDCTCEHCRRSFRDWLKARHGSLENLNANLGTIFWSQEYTRWDQIPLPDNTGNHHPSLRLEYRRWFSGNWTEYANKQREIIKSVSPGLPVTTNAYLFRWGDELDHTQLFADFDRYSFDNYANEPWEGAFYTDFAQSVKPGFWILEQKSGGPNGQYFYPDEEQRIAFYADQAFDRGCELISYFRWRQCLFGHEQEHGALIEHDGEPSRFYDELKDYTPQARNLNNKWAVLFTYPDSWTRSIARRNDYIEYITQSVYAGMYRPEDRISFVFDRAGVDSLREKGIEKLLIPLKSLYDEALFQSVYDFIRGGGTAVFTPDTGTKDEYGKFHTWKMPPGLADVLGVKLNRQIHLNRELDTSLPVSGKEVAFKISHRLDEIILTGADSLGKTGSGPSPDNPLVTVNSYSQGKGVYLTGLYSRDFWTILGDLL